MYESLPPVSKLWPFNVHATEYQSFASRHLMDYGCPHAVLGLRTDLSNSLYRKCPLCRSCLARDPDFRTYFPFYRVLN